MNRQQRRELERKKGQVVKAPLPKEGEIPKEVRNFIDAFVENNQSMDFFFKAVAVWTRMPLEIKELVMLQAIKEGQINLEEENEGKNSEGQ